jgi:hypothetical protein
MDSLDMTHHYSALRTCDLDTVDAKLRQQFHIQWLQNIQNTPKLRTYKLLKNQYNVEKYVELNIPKNVRSAMAMFRCGVLPLRIETGRYKSEPIEDRICVFCNLNEIETEKHFLLHCPLYNQLREDFFRKIQMPPFNFRLFRFCKYNCELSTTDSKFYISCLSNQTANNNEKMILYIYLYLHCHITLLITDIGPLGPGVLFIHM